jgi:hypothetical protein
MNGKNAMWDGRRVVDEKMTVEALVFGCYAEIRAE